MGWNISNVENTVVVSKQAARLINQRLQDVSGDDEEMVEKGTLVFSTDWYEHMDYIGEILEILENDKVNGLVSFASTEGDNRNTMWGYRFTDGVMEYDSVKLGKTLFAKPASKAKTVSSPAGSAVGSVASKGSKDESVSLYYKDAGSDKEYHAQLVALADGSFEVRFQYGKRGGTLAQGTKVTGVVYEKAKKAYDKVVAEKTGKGYQPIAGAAASFLQGDGEFSGQLPQLLNEIFDDSVAVYLADDSWLMQQKFDGHNRQMRKASGTLESINRKGFVVGAPSETMTALDVLSVHGDWHVAGELMGNVFAIFDVRLWKGVDVASKPLEERLAILNEIRALVSKEPLLIVSETAVGHDAKAVLWAKMSDGNYEGVVFKKAGSSYVPGRPSSGGNQLKYRFWKNATFRVSGHSSQKRSVLLEVMDEAGFWVQKGKVTIPVNYDVPTIGALVDVRYLYAYPGGALAQPNYEGERDDLDEKDCLESRLVFKRADADDENEE